VDDEPLIRDTLTRLLRRENYIVAEAADAEAAMQVLDTSCIGVILIDRNMPGRGGDWLIEQVQDRFAATAIILATGEYVPPHVAMQRGIVGFLAKPFTAGAVRDAVADAAAWHQVAARNRHPP
jgi:DNA-binding NtrC family response regulator